MRFKHERCCMKCAPLGDVSRSVRLSQEVRWNHTHVLKAIYGLMTHVDNILYGTATGDVPSGELGWGDAQSLGEKDKETILPFTLVL